MTKADIEQTELYKYVSGLPMDARYSVLLGTYKEKVQSTLDVTIEEWSFSKLGDVPDKSLALSVKDPYGSFNTIAVLTPKES